MFTISDKKASVVKFSTLQKFQLFFPFGGHQGRLHLFEEDGNQGCDFMGGGKILHLFIAFSFGKPCFNKLFQNAARVAGVPIPLCSASVSALFEFSIEDSRVSSDKFCQVGKWKSSSFIFHITSNYSLHFIVKGFCCFLAEMHLHGISGICNLSSETTRPSSVFLFHSFICHAVLLL